MMFRRNKKTPLNNVRVRTNASTGKPVFSYYARGTSSNDNNIGRYEKKPGTKYSLVKKLNYHHIPTYIAFSVIVVSLFHTLLLQPSPKIIVVDSPGTIHRNSKSYLQSISSIWSKSIFNRTKLTVATNELESEIHNNFNELQGVRIELPLLGKRATVVLTPGKPLFMLVSRNGSFYINKHGMVMAKTIDVTENKLSELPKVIDDSGISAEEGKVILPGTQAEIISKLFQQLRKENIEVESVTLPSGAANEADVRVVGQAYYIKFSLDKDPRQGVGTYIAAKLKLETEGTLPTEYIDVRVEEKAFYR